MKPIAVVILAAGKGKRMKSDLPKVLHEVGGKPMIDYVIRTARKINPQRIVLVIGHKYQMVLDYLKDSDLELVIQKEQLGTGHAVMQAEKILSGFDGMVVILCGDVPFLKAETIGKLIDQHKRRKACATVLTAIVEDASGYGRIKRDNSGLVEKIVEELDATDEDKKIKEINSGIFCFEAKPLFAKLKKTGKQNKQGEYYLTDVLKLMRDENLPIAALVSSNPNEVLGINSIEQLKEMEKLCGCAVRDDSG